MSNIKFSRVWSMPNKHTYDIKPIKELIERYLVNVTDDMVSIDPFANKSKLAKITNDLDKNYDTSYHMDAKDFLEMFDDDSVDFVLYDPPYSPRQVSECYKELGLSVNKETTQSSYWKNFKDQIKRITKKDGIVISFGWNSGGIGKTNGFEIIEVMLVPHGGAHNDTIVTVERKIK